MSSSAPGEKHGVPTTNFGYQSSNPSAPLLPSSPYNPTGPSTEPPPYSDVVAQDSASWKNPPSSFPAGNTVAPYPPTSTAQSQAPYPTGPGLAQGSVGQAPYPAQAPYPNQTPYPAGPGYIPGPASQAPYPVASMPMPAPVDTDRHIGFTAPVTTEPKSGNFGYPAGGYPQGPNVQGFPDPVYGNQGAQQGLIYPISPGANNQYVQSQYVPNQYGQQQQQQPNTVYVVQKAPNQSSTTDDDCCLLACCLASCYCFCECLKICAATDS